MNNQEQDKLNQELSQANKAKQLFDNPLLQESFQKLRELYSNSLLNTGASENETREKLWLAYQMVGKVEQNLIEMIDTGKLASKQLEDFRNQIKNKMLNTNTTKQIRSIKSKVKSSVSNDLEFKNDESVIAFAVEKLYQELKKKKLL